MNIDKIIEELEERRKIYIATGVPYNNGYADGIQTALLILIRLKEEGIK